MKILAQSKIQRLVLTALLMVGISVLLWTRIQHDTVTIVQPANYGLPDKIAGYDVLAAVPTNFHLCAEINTITLVVQVSESTMDEYLRSGGTQTNILEAIKELDPAGKLTISVVGSETTREQLRAEYATLEKGMRDAQVGCISSGLSLLGGGIMTLTPTTETFMASPTPD